MLEQPRTRNEVGGEALVFAVRPTRAFAFAKDDYGQTRRRSDRT